MTHARWRRSWKRRTKGCTRTNAPHTPTTPMTMITERLQDPHAFSICEAIQQEITGTALIPTSIMVDIERSGGLIIGARENEADFHGVKNELQNQGIGYHLRLRERMEGKRKGIALVTWTIDPLESRPPHLAFNKLAAIAASYKRNMYGEATVPDHRGLATRSLATRERGH